MSYYCAIYTDKPLEEMLEKHPTHPKTWVQPDHREYVWIKEGDFCKDPNGADELGPAEHFYFADWWVSPDRVLCLADDYLRILGGRIYVIELLCEGSVFFDGFEGLEGFEGLAEIHRNDIRYNRDVPAMVKTLDLKDVSEELHRKSYMTNINLDDLESLRSPISLEPYVIHEVVNSGYKNG